LAPCAGRLILIHLVAVMSDPLGESITRTRRTGGYHLVADTAASLEAPRSKFQTASLGLKGRGLYSRIELLRSHLFF
jgi:hypothetical protein